MPLPLGAGSAPPGVPVVTYPTYRLYSGDRVGIIVFGQDNLSRLYSVDTAGRIAFPLIGTVEARGLSTTQLASEIEGKLKKNYIKDPKVTVEVDAYRPFFILGEVTKPRNYPYVDGMTVESAVAIAEGYAERANQRMVRRTRRWGDDHGHGPHRLSRPARRHHLRPRTLLLKLTEPLTQGSYHGAP